MRPIQVAIIGGAGQRACDIYIPYSLASIEDNTLPAMEVAAIIDPDMKNLEFASRFAGGARSFTSIDEFVQWDGHPRVIINATSDSAHMSTTLPFLLTPGYRILLEKPLSTTLEDSIHLVETDTQNPGSYLEVFLEMRETLYRQVREIVKSGALGTITRVEHTENVGWYHFVHSYRRGNWCNSTKAAHIVNAKMCHDWDTLLWTFGYEDLISIASATFPNIIVPENAPADAEYCGSCRVYTDCKYSAQNLYLAEDSPIVSNGTSLKKALSRTENINEIKAHIKGDGDFARCAYRCDQEFPERFVTRWQYKESDRYPKGLLIVAAMDGLSHRITRQTKIIGSQGTLFSDMYDGTLYIERPDGSREHFSVEKGGAHGGGDFPRIAKFLTGVINGKPAVAPAEALKAETIGHMIIQGMDQQDPVYFRPFILEKRVAKYF